MLALFTGCANETNGKRTDDQSGREVASHERDSVIQLVPLFDHVRADLRRKVVEFDAEVSPILVKDDRAPLVFLEVLACIPGTREHETLVVTKATPSNVHAALLAVGVQAGSPGGFEWTDGALHPIEPRGQSLHVRFVWDDHGQDRDVDPMEWVVNAADGATLKSFADREKIGFVFAGSRIVKVNGQERYGADLGGNVVGLTTFGDEVIGLSKSISPDSSVQAPEWIAQLDAVPPAGTAVRVRVRAIETPNPAR